MKMNPCRMNTELASTHDTDLMAELEPMFEKTVPQYRIGKPDPLKTPLLAKAAVVLVVMAWAAICCFAIVGSAKAAPNERILDWQKSQVQCRDGNGDVASGCWAHSNSITIIGNNVVREVPRHGDMADITRYGPDELGVVCYKVLYAGRPAIACLKVQP